MKAMTTAALGLVLLSPAAWAQQPSQALIDRLDRLERDLQAVTRMVARGETGTAPAGTAADQAADMQAGPVAARLSLRIQALERDLQGLTGRVEEFTFRLDRIDQRLDKLVSDIDYRLSSLEGRAPGAAPVAGFPTVPEGAASGIRAAPVVPSGDVPAQAAVPQTAPGPGTLGVISKRDLETLRAPGSPAEPVAPPPAGADAEHRQLAGQVPQQAALPEGTVKEQYDHAFALLRKTDYAQAQEALEAFVTAHEGSGEPLVGNARYWLGETHYVRSDYVSAAQVFFEGFEKDPTGAKAPDTLLKLGMSLANLGKPNEACATFEKLLADYPQASATLRKRAEGERRRTGCT